MAGSAQPLGAESGARRYQLFINGKFVDSRSGKRFESISPHDRAVVAVVAEGDKADIDAAVASARAAYEGTWSTTPAGERARVLNKIADLLAAHALACGNAVVLKPAEHTPMTSLELARLTAEAGLPEGVLNVVPGFGPTAGAALASHPGVDKIAFTGEYVTGRLIVQMSATNLKTVTLELGGKSPHIIFDDVDLETAVTNALFGIYMNTGQICSAGTRILVQDSMYDRFIERFVERSQQIKIGDPLDFATRMGPLVSEEQQRKVERYVEIGKKEGAHLRCGGGQPKDPALAKGFYFEPTVFTEVDNKMQIAQEEIFGPVASILKFHDEDDAVRIGNDVIYGLAAGVQTKDLKRAHRLAKRLQAGTVWINTWHMIEANSPFGGYKLSGYGRENGIAMVEHLTKLKQVWVDLNDFTMDFFGM